MKTHNRIHAETSLATLLDDHPATRSVLNRHGLWGCGGDRVPNESVRFFAAAHGADLEGLLQELRMTADDPSADDQAAALAGKQAGPCPADAIYRPYFLAGIAIVLTAGAAWGAYLLWKIGMQGSFTAVTVHEVNAHGHAQIMGWVGLFIMGFGYQVLPRIWQTWLPAARLAVAAWVVMLLSIVLRSVAMTLYGASWAAPMHGVGAVLETAAVSVFVIQLMVAWRRGGTPVEPYVGFIFAGLFFMVLQTVAGGWHIHRLLTVPDREAMLAQVAMFQAPLRDIQIHGMALMMIFGVGLRLFPAMLGVASVGATRAWAALGLTAAAVALEAGLFLAYRAGGSPAAAAGLMLPWLMLPIGAWLIVGPWRLWRRPPEPGRIGKFVRAAFVWLFVSFAMLLFLPVYQWLSGIPFSHAYYGAIRHAVTVGFVTMMMVGVASKVAPMLRGVGPDRLPDLTGVFVLLNLGCLLRVSLQVLSDWDPLFFRLVSVSGVLEWTALAWWSMHLASVMLGLGRYRDAHRTGCIMMGRATAAGG
ncbi:MAG: NnrS family protein [Phycisphaeraceae bacterium]|nr:NnrS family protein [Phycisphaeraceae bacterium]